MTVLEPVAALDDEQAIRALTFILAYEDRTPPAPDRPQLDAALREVAGDPALADFHEARAVTDGDLARAALAVLAESPEVDPTVVDEAVEMTHRPGRPALEVVGVVSMAAVVLQSEVKFERTPDGKWHILLHKRPTRDSTVGQLLSKVIAYFTQGR